jgi:hypothetical protein
MVFRQRNGDVIKVIRIHDVSFLCALAQRQSSGVNTAHWQQMSNAYTRHYTSLP